MRNQIVLILIIAISILVPMVVALLIFLPGRPAHLNINVSSLPFFHALLNGTTAMALITGYFFIRCGKITFHKYCMLTAFFLSSVFLVSYIIYHYTSGHTPFGGTGAVRLVYFFILITHIFLATAIVPLALITIYRGLSGDYIKHRKIARWTFPIWLYVAISGVLVYLFMIPYYA